MTQNKKDISFILPTNRDPDQFANKVIENINSLNFHGRSHEIIVVGPHPLGGSNVVYVAEHGDNNGCVTAYNEGYNFSSGDYIFLCSDDHYFDPNCVLITDVLESKPFQKRKYKIICLPTNRHAACPLPEYTNCTGIIARYPVFSRETVEDHLGGYIYHPAFRHHYPDNWLGYWLYQQGEPPVEYNKFDMITFNNSCYKGHDEYDEEKFKELIKRYHSESQEYV